MKQIMIYLKAQERGQARQVAFIGAELPLASWIETENSRTLLIRVFNG